MAISQARPGVTAASTRCEHCRRDHSIAGNSPAYARGSVKVKRATALGPVFGADAAAMQLDQVLDNRQSQAGAARIAGARLVDAIEALENPRQILFGNSGPAIGDRDLDRGRRPGRR